MSGKQTNLVEMFISEYMSAARHTFGGVSTTPQCQSSGDQAKSYYASELVSGRSSGSAA